MSRFAGLILVLIGLCLAGCASNTVVEATNVGELGGYRLRNGQIEALVSPTIGRVISLRRIGGEDIPISPDDLNGSLSFRVVSASDGKLVVESPGHKTFPVMIRRVYRLDDEKLMIETTIEPVRDEGYPSR